MLLLVNPPPGPPQAIYTDWSTAKYALDMKVIKYADSSCYGHAWDCKKKSDGEVKKKYPLTHSLLPLNDANDFNEY